MAFQLPLQLKVTSDHLLFILKSFNLLQILTEDHYLPPICWPLEQLASSGIAGDR